MFFCNRLAKRAAMLGLLALPCASLSQFSFHSFNLGQVDWYDQGGGLAAPNSIWGRFGVEYTPDPSQTYYLNLSLGNSPTSPPYWAVQNAPLFFVDNGDFSIRTEMVELDLRGVGISPGMDWSSTYWGISIDTLPDLSAPSLGNVPASVFDFSWRAWDSPDELMPPGGLFTDPGIPLGVAGGVLQALSLATRRVMNGVQEHVNHCFAGSTARSLDWLNRTHNLNMGRTAQQMYDDLRAAGVSQPNADRTKARERWIRQKNAYARERSNNMIITKVWDSGGWLDPIPGITEEGGDFLTWLEREWRRGEDIELIYNWDNGGHIVTLVNLYKQGGKTFAEYRDDEEQGDDTKGDGLGGARYPAVKKREIFKDGDIYRFGSRSNRISWAVSESLVPEPGSITALACGIGFLIARRRRKQNG